MLFDASKGDVLLTTVIFLPEVPDVTVLFMPWSLKRYQNTGDLHFITFSCRRREPRLGSPGARDVAEKALEAMRLRSGASIHAYVFMPEHVHLLIDEPKSQALSTAIQGLKQAVSFRLGRGHQPFWESRYYDFNVFSDRKRIEKLAYIHRNPVRRGLVLRPEDWAWSSSPQYTTGELRTVRLAFQIEAS